MANYLDQAGLQALYDKLKVDFSRQLSYDIRTEVAFSNYVTRLGNFIIPSGTKNVNIEAWFIVSTNYTYADYLDNRNLGIFHMNIRVDNSSVATLRDFSMIAGSFNPNKVFIHKDSGTKFELWGDLCRRYGSLGVVFLTGGRNNTTNFNSLATYLSFQDRNLTLEDTAPVTDNVYPTSAQFIDVLEINTSNVSTYYDSATKFINFESIRQEVMISIGDNNGQPVITELNGVTTGGPVGQRLYITIDTDTPPTFGSTRGASGTFPDWISQFLTQLSSIRGFRYSYLEFIKFNDMWYSKSYS